MAAATYSKANWQVEADAQQLPNGKYQGIVLVSNKNKDPSKKELHTVADLSDTIDGAFEEAKLLAHHLLGNL
ncbi:MAG TPA: hypothetical protein VIF82_15750 [Burkholderiaceae bacterium]|jgi:hypothetical protein